MGTVLINDVTKDDINAALIRIQKQIGSSGGGSGNAQGTTQTIQNIQIQNSGSGNSDLSALYSTLSNMQKTIKEQGAKIEELEKSKASLVQTTQQTVNNISDIQSILNSGITGDITSVTFDNSTRIMSFNTTNGIFNVEVPTDNEVMRKEIQVTNSNAGKYTKICSYSYPYTIPRGNPNADYSREDLSFSLMLYTSFRDYTPQGLTDPAEYDTISGTHIIMVGQKVTSQGSQYHPGPADVSYSGATLKAYTFNGKGVIPDDAILIKDEWLTENHGSYGTRRGVKYTIYLKNIQNGFKYSIVALSKGLWDFTTEEVSASSLTYPTWTYANFVKIQPPVDTVALNNMQSVTSNAVSRALSVVIGETDTGGTWIDGKKIYRRIDTWSLNTLPTGNSNYTFSSSYWTQIDTLIDARLIRPKSNNLYPAILPYPIRFDIQNKIIFIYNVSTEWTGPFLLDFIYTKN